jgi:hypothetical protein
MTELTTGHNIRYFFTTRIMSENSTRAADAKLRPDDFEMSINDLESEYNVENESGFSSDEEYMKYV